jgi:uncharacterized protein (TIGR02147 family)
VYLLPVTKPLFDELFQYDDYRRFLGDFFEDQKRKRAAFSHRYFAQKAGFTSSSFCLSVIKGRYNLSSSATEKMVRAMELDPRQAIFFGALIRYNQSKSATEREAAWVAIQSIRRQVEFTSLTLPQQGYFSRWFYPVLRELVTHPAWDGNWITLARRVDPALTVEETREALHNLESWGLIEKTPEGKFRCSSVLLNAEGVPPIALREIRREFLQLGIGALDSKPPSQRFTTFTTLAMSESSYEYALKVLEEARRKIIAKAAGDERVEKVYEMVLQVFPLTKLIAEEKR